MSYVSKTRPIARSNNLVVQELDGEVLVYDTTNNQAHALNRSSSLVWQSCDGKHDISDIAAIVGGELDGAISDDFVWLALTDLKKNGLVEYEGDAAGNGAGLSRRELIKRVGLASMVALPIVSSLVAPAAVNAQSVPMACTSCVMKSGGAPACPTVCDDNVTGTCYDNAGCGSGAFLFNVTCTVCHTTGGQTGQPSTVSWTAN